MKTPPRSSSLSDLMWEAGDLGAGLAIVAIPLFAIALPGVLLFFVVPAALLAVVAAVPAVVLGLLAAPPYLLYRGVRAVLQR